MTRVRLLDAEAVQPPAEALVQSLDSAGNFINLYRVMAHSPVSLQRFIELASAAWSGGLPQRTIEIAILSTVSAMRARYPLAWHIGDARDAGLTDAEISASLDDEGSDLDAVDAAVARFARQLTLDAALNEATFEEVRAQMDERQIVELTLLVGLYNLVGRVANGLEVELDPDAARLLEAFG